MQRELFKDFYEKYSEPVYNYLLKITRSEEMAQEVLQQTFVSLYEKYDSLTISNELSYLMSMARNFYLQILRKGKKIAASIDDVAEIREKKNFTSKIDWQTVRDSILTKLENTDALLKEIFILRLDHEMQFAQIGEIINQSERNVRRHFDKIRTLIIENFSEDLDI